jgi:hypothetical protein
MKLRLKGNTVRFRLTKTEVKLIGDEGYLKEQTEFFPDTFFYAVKSDDSVNELMADFKNGGITLLIPEAWAKDWVNSEQVGFEGWMKTKEDKSIYLLLEKDFKCLDETTEDQSDNFENPNVACTNE